MEEQGNAETVDAVQVFSERIKELQYQLGNNPQYGLFKRSFIEKMIDLNEKLLAHVVKYSAIH